MYVVTLSVFHNLAIWLLYVNKPEPEPEYSSGKKVDSHSASESVKRKYYVTLRTTSQSLIQKLLASVEFDAVCCKKS